MKKSQENIFDDIYEIVKLVPAGRVTSYGAIAKYLGLGAARMVGWAMNASHGLPDVPAHRVVNRIGLLTGKHHFGGNRMQELLESEGVKVEKDQVVNFKAIFWNPSEELL
ncbi:Methylated-DNA-(protein)-cysteine S-methyltransferase DNA binding protein [Emticicia oligotrophica DSM 17448]|uniref:Methylated-DNA-(Protein)-cysteine S-methyltransferase DNA binding protein n=1 Tax=Emticicia oligotrophica (strain DSM 17448 / CIP 109782 / MTCC 6937 / GPTSA100-15) TaxID=929562 RepID=A0ABM5N564_EMTOG|nr:MULTISPECIES: MGMT family protein [Emticicia]AFK04655.1 Methylated-DNA-(protein)-cysteine S-methyltransferase DNA binding protein [Emticicia oligotrophica DSM 17448]